jgi:hypothetical protein
VLGGLTLIAAASELRLTEPHLLFGSSFESGAVIKGDGWIVSGNKGDVTGEQKREGQYAHKSYLHYNNSSPNYRSELRALAPAPVMGKDTWYGFSIYLPGPYERDELGETLAQWHSTLDPGEGNLNPPLSLLVKDGQWVLFSRWNPYQPTVKGKTQQASFQFGQRETNKWTDWVFRVRWSYRSDGQLQVWKNGQMVLNRNGPNAYNDKVMPYFKVGIYKSPWRTKVGDVKERTVYHDEVRIAGPGSSYSDVVPR